MQKKRKQGQKRLCMSVLVLVALLSICIWQHSQIESLQTKLSEAAQIAQMGAQTPVHQEEESEPGDSEAESQGNSSTALEETNPGDSETESQGNSSTALEETNPGDSEAESQGNSSTASEEETVLGIVARQIAPDGSKEAIKAQCVIARTSLRDAVKSGTEVPAGYEDDEMKTMWGADYKANMQKLRECVQETAGEVLLWEGNYLYAPYHAISAGETRNVSELYPDAKLPYLTSVACKEDTTAEGYLTVYYMEGTEFVEKCRQYFPEAGADSVEKIRIDSRDTAGYVLWLTVGNTSVTGEEFRDKMGLQSSCFSIKQLENGVRIVTKGIGHGFGLSQSQAEYMAESGSDYREILSYFYPGVTLAGQEDLEIS
jgi:stage II sporulation protein D